MQTDYLQIGDNNYTLDEYRQWITEAVLLVENTISEFENAQYRVLYLRQIVEGVMLLAKIEEKNKCYPCDLKEKLKRTSDD